MRLIGRGTTEDSSHPVHNADVVLQLGDSKIPLKATQLLGQSVRLSRNPETEGLQKPRDPFDRVSNDEDKAIEAFSRMQEALSPRQPAADTAFSPWSPDDLYAHHPYQSQPNLPLANASHDTLHGLRREPSDANLPAYYDPAEHPYYVAQQTSASAVRDMALHKGAPTIFDNFGEAPPPRRHPNSSEMRQHELAQRSKTTGGTSPRISRRLDLVQLFPQPRQSSGRLLSPSRLQHSPSAMTERTLPPLPTDPEFRRSQTTRPSTSASGPGRKKQRPFDEDILDQHKTNVRRPPKGIQNWFDAYLDSDDDDEDEEDEELDGPSPQELPANDVLPPAYSSPERMFSHASEKSASGLRGHERIHSDLKSIEHDIAHAQFHRKTSSSDSGTSNSIQSSHQGNRRRDKYESRLASSTMAGESVLSLSESDYDDEEDDDGKSQLPPIRDSIMNMDSGHITIANASSIDVVRLQRPTQLSSVRHMPPTTESKRSSSQSSVPTPIAGRRDKPLPVSPQIANATATDPAALRRLNGLSYESVGTISSGTSFHDVGQSTHPESQHLMEVSEEEKMLLDLMRRKRAAMQQMSFTEGYQLALQTEQDRLAKHSASAEQRALKALKKKSSRHSDRESAAPVTTPPSMPSESDMRRQFSQIRKASVDERFQIERFLGMSQPQPLSSHPPDQSMPTELPHARMPSGELLPSTRFSPTAYSPASQIATNTEENSGYCSADDCETESARIRVRQFISTNGAVPPLNSMKTMRRRSNRQPASMPPSPIAEENAAPPVPQRSPDRPMTRDFSFDEALIRRQVSSLSNPEDTQDWGASPVSTYMSPNAEIMDDVQMQSLQRISRDPIMVPPRVGSVPPEAFSKSHAMPAPTRISFSPFSNIINAAAASKPNVHRVDSTQEPREQDVALMSGGRGDKPAQQRAPLPRLNTFDSALDHRASMLSITSAGEEVLGAWADLGGGRDCLRTKRKS